MTSGLRNLRAAWRTGPRMVTGTVCALGVVVLASSLRADGDDSKEPAASSMEQLSFMSGTWQGSIFGGPIVETWSKADGGVMLGSSKMGATREKAMYEFMLIEEHDGAPTMFLRHFRQYLATKETRPMEFRLAKVDGKTAVFECPDKRQTFTRITYRLASDDELVVTLEGERDGQNKVEAAMKRTKDR